jgi:hypothetical protein
MRGEDRMTFEKAVEIAKDQTEELLQDLDNRIARMGPRFLLLRLANLDPDIERLWREWWIHLLVQALVDAGEADAPVRPISD